VSTANEVSVLVPNKNPGLASNDLHAKNKTQKFSSKNRSATHRIAEFIALARLHWSKTALNTHRGEEKR